MSHMFHFDQFDCGGVREKYTSMDFGSETGGRIAKPTNLCGTNYCEESKDNNSLCSDFWFDEDKKPSEELLLSRNQKEKQVQLFSDLGSLDNLGVDNNVSPPFQDEEIPKLVSIQPENSEVIELKKKRPRTFPLASLKILKNYGSRFQQLNWEKTNVSTYNTSCPQVSDKKLSTHEIIRLAGEKFIQSYSHMVDELSVLSHPFVSSFLGKSDEEDVELVQYLLASAEKVGQKQFDRGRKLLNLCDGLSSKEGNPIQRLVHYFSEALREKINRETGNVTTKGLGMKQWIDLEEATTSTNPTVIAFYQVVPFSQVSQFTAVQSLIDHIGNAKKVHIIDLEIRSGIQCMVLMQALVARCECPVDRLKVTAVGTRSKPRIEETGKWLMSFAQSMDLPFSFKVVMVADMLDLNEDLFELDAEEEIAVYSSYSLRSLIAWPRRVECLMRVMRKINPCVMVVTEVEAKLNSPIFVNRFIEALFHYGAFFDSMEDCMYDDETHRMISEKIFSQAIRNIVAAEGEERTIRNVNINVWREFFARFGMVEIDLSMSSLYQANLIRKNFACGSSCTLEMDGKSLIIGWKETPIHCVSAWKFL